MLNAIYQDFIITRKMVKAQREANNKYKKDVLIDLAEIENFKSQYGFWDEWSGGGFTRRINPRPNKDTNMQAICEGHPVYGWRAKPDKEEKL